MHVVHHWHCGYRVDPATGWWASHYSGSQENIRKNMPAMLPLGTCLSSECGSSFWNSQIDSRIRLGASLDRPASCEMGGVAHVFEPVVWCKYHRVWTYMAGFRSKMCLIVGLKNNHRNIGDISWAGRMEEVLLMHGRRVDERRTIGRSVQVRVCTDVKE